MKQMTRKNYAIQQLIQIKTQSFSEHQLCLSSIGFIVLNALLPINSVGIMAIPK